MLTWGAALMSVCALVIGALTPISLLAGRLARLEQRCDTADRDRGEVMAMLRELSRKQDDLAGLVGRIGGVRTRE